MIVINIYTGSCSWRSDQIMHLQYKQTVYMYCIYIDWCFKGKFECQKDIYFKTQPGPVAKNATRSLLAGNWTHDPGSLDQCSTDWGFTEAMLWAWVRVLYIYIGGNAGEVKHLRVSVDNACKCQILSLIYLYTSLALHAPTVYRYNYIYIYIYIYIRGGADPKCLGISMDL